MSQIHFVDGEKGGVGKSFFTRALVYHCLAKKLSFHLIDSDRSNPDVHKRYPDISQTIFFSEVEKKSNDADRIFELCEKFASQIKHILVQNYFSADEDDWEMIYREYPKLQEIIKTHNIPTLAFPRLGTTDKNLIDQNQWTFEQTIDRENTQIGALSKQRVVTFLRSLSHNLDQLGIFTPESFKSHSAKAKKPAA
ncbi:hypothetical protein [Coleofasciculus sp.]|uniref:hypothetical protein n=1 Tax=Coleofasciculus sp. TaxID=3100458 RepID=UPI0039F91CCA